MNDFITKLVLLLLGVAIAVIILAAIINNLDKILSLFFI